MTSGGEPKDLQVKDLLASLPTGPAEIAQSDALKAAANAAFGQRAFSEAVDLYSQAIAYTPTSAPLHANRALAYNRLELYGAALNDADAAISLDPTYIKGYYRRAVAVMALGRLKDAVKDFRAVVKVAPQDADARKKLAACEKELKKIEFEKAISFDDDQKSALDLIGDFDNMVVEAAYV